ncbi:hypothetical protein FAGKG844_220001 [Frankia sp. AgKG'84/4]
MLGRRGYHIQWFQPHRAHFTVRALSRGFTEQAVRYSHNENTEADW